MPTASRPQRYDHRLRDLVQRTGDLTIAAKLGVPRSTARGWLGTAPTVVISLEVANLTETKLRQEVLKLRRRVEKLAALLRLALALLHASGFRLSGARVPDGQAKRRILRAVERPHACVSLRRYAGHARRLPRIPPSTCGVAPSAGHLGASDPCASTPGQRCSAVRSGSSRGVGPSPSTGHGQGTAVVLPPTAAGRGGPYAGQQRRVPSGC